MKIDRNDPRGVGKALAELKIQAMMFDMDIDIETWSLVPKSTYIKQKWLEDWKDKVANSDRPQTLGLEDVDRE